MGGRRGSQSPPSPWVRSSSPSPALGIEFCPCVWGIGPASLL